MHSVISSSVIGVAMILGVGGCSSSDTTAPAVAGTPNYSFSVSGDQAHNANGVSFTSYLANGYSESTNGGTPAVMPVSLVVLAETDLTKPQVDLGLLGSIKPGTYTVRSRAFALGSRQEFYGLYMVPGSDGGQRHYEASEGTVTITEVSPAIRGSFTFHAGRVLLVPPIVDISVGAATPLTASPASLDVSGTFVARAP